MSTQEDEFRRWSDSHPTPCPALKEHAEIMSGIFQELREIKQRQKDTLDMLAAWNNAKGFVSTMKTFGIIVLWIVGILAAFTALSETIRHWLVGK